MAWEEWEQLKAAAAERQSAHTQLNQLPADQGGTSPSATYGPPSGRLRSDKTAWSKAGEGLGELRTGMGKALKKLEDAQTGLDKKGAFLTATAQLGVFDSWERRAKDIGEWCDGLAGVLEKTGNDQLRTDEAIRAEIAALSAGGQDGSASHGSDG
ncbi:hypothetical protein [Streptomyces tagetis]|uniref:Uncharacterized protein n=1 Tax=Streptomyces tagetis TaxID=2820809 RepID=A0A940XHT3_9ACTN|nr:hypothetical protein [Streptomyces sp. RG38]MBQ0828646.1 hypothetical protein [Streptomyces sp. RG38]